MREQEPLDAKAVVLHVRPVLLLECQHAILSHTVGQYYVALV